MQRPGDDLLPPLRRYLTERASELDRIDGERRSILDDLARFVVERSGAGRLARLTFVCTHNSRRSHMAELFAAAAARFHGVEPFESFSGGTEATALAPHAAEALRRAGFDVRGTEDSAPPNPAYEIVLGESLPPRRAFSKVFTDPANPSSDFAAVMTCSEADAACPSVPGASLRVSLPYEDPKNADGTDEESGTYDARCREIAREMMYLMSRVASLSDGGSEK